MKRERARVSEVFKSRLPIAAVAGDEQLKPKILVRAPNKLHKFLSRLPFIFGILMMILGFTGIWQWALITGVVGLTLCYLLWNKVLDRIK